MSSRPLAALASALAAAALLASCEPACAAQRLYRNTVETASHVEVPGTQVKLVPPRGAVPADGFRGFEDASRELRIEVIVSSSPFDSVMGELTAEQLESQGIAVKSETEVVFNGGRGALIEGEREDGAMAIAFVLESSGRTTAIWGHCSRADVQAVRESLLSAVPMKEKKQSAAPRTSYALRTDGTPLKFVEEINFTRTYRSEDGRATLTSEMMTIGPDADDRTAFAEKLFAELMAQREHISSGASPVSRAGMQGVEISASFDGDVRHVRTASGGRVSRPRPGCAYQLVLFSPTDAEGRARAYVIRGISTIDADAYMAHFKRIASSFVLTADR